MQHTPSLASQTGARQVGDIVPLQEVRKDDNDDGIADLLGDTVRVTGIANIGTGRLHEVYLQIFIQNDTTGLSIFSDSVATPINQGDSVVATGVVQQYYGLTELRAIDYRTLPRSGPMPDPVPLTKLVGNPAPFEGMMVEGSARIVGKGTRFNGKYLNVTPVDSKSGLWSIMVYVTNFHSQYAEFDFESLSIGDRIRIMGILSEYDPEYPGSVTYKIMLRTPNDLEILGIAQSTLTLIGIGGVIVSLLVIGWIISLRSRVKSKTRKIRKSLEEKEVLLKEIHHRVKNNLSIVSALIELQLDTSMDEADKKVLRDSQSRILSMALVHDKLYSTGTVTDISMQTYITELVEALESSVTGPETNIDIDLEIDDIQLDIDQAIPCGLLINELVVNALKHAFPASEKGSIAISLFREHSEVVLTVADDGRGLPEDVKETKGSSLGLMLIDTFARQLNAALDVRNGDGARFILRFPVNAAGKASG
ncbi:MAG: histidine kinase dimerization/phosphoacceptor domain -containing protein [Balneolaceae bacterium]|nr:histidine kinase dimerization/phosphoacceptor domain -containing protein [Balneolaceae bacterium]